MYHGESTLAQKELFWARFDETSSELVKAKRRLRDGTGSELEVLRFQSLLAAIRQDLATLGEYADACEPGD